MDMIKAELAALVAAYDEHGGKWPQHHEDALFEAVEHARAVLAQPGPAPAADGEVIEGQLLVAALRPIPVSERLPGPEDCLPWPDEPDETHWCWAFVKGPLDMDSWERRPVSCLTTYRTMHTHWLPAHALPLPEEKQ